MNSLSARLIAIGVPWIIRNELLMVDQGISLTPVGTVFEEQELIEHCADFQHLAPRNL